MSRRRKRHHEEEHENHERWLVSYADFITLLFAFFVVLYSVSRVDNKKLQQVALGIQWAMHYSGTGGNAQMPIFEGPSSEGGGITNMVNPPRAVRELHEQQQAVEALRRRIETRVRSFVMEKSGAPAVTVEVEDRLVKVRLAAADLFEPGESALRPQVLPVLDAIAAEIVPVGRPIQVEGHTDGQPVSGLRYRDNWELSAARAARVASYLELAHGVAPGRLSAAGFGSTRPVAEGDSPRARELNRRVELVLTLDVQAPAPTRLRLATPAAIPDLR